MSIAEDFFVDFSKPDENFGHVPRITFRYTAEDNEGEYAVVSATEALASVGFGLNVDRVPQDRMEEKSTIGSQVHWMIADFLTTSSVPDDRAYYFQERTMAYWECWWNWYRKHRQEHQDFRAVAVEVPHIMTGDRVGWVPESGIAGTTDLIDWEDGSFGITDWKCRIPYPYDGYQTALYGLLAANNPNIPVNAYDLARLRRRCVYLNEKGKPARVAYFDNPWDYKVAESCVIIWHARVGNKRVRRNNNGR